MGMSTDRKSMDAQYMFHRGLGGSTWVLEREKAGDEEGDDEGEEWGREGEIREATMQSKVLRKISKRTTSNK